MAQLCHDQYDHPLLWCGEKRRAEDRKNLRESLELVQQQREVKEIQKVRDISEVRRAMREKSYITLNLDLSLLGLQKCDPI